MEWSEYSRQLAQRQASNTLRALPPKPDLIDFASNDYLGFARSPELWERIHHGAQLFQVNGSTGSRLLTGNSSLHEETEAMLATYFEGSAALIFSSGYAANLGVISTLPQKGDTVLLDAHAHACMKDGARLSLAKHWKFRHNDLNDLELKIKSASGRIFIVIESVYSMDGDECPLPEIVNLAEQYDAIIILDEAHSTGIYGSGKGFAIEKNKNTDRIIRIHTFGKALGIHGACVICPELIKSYLLNFCRPFIYTTAPGPHEVIAIREAIKYLGESPYYIKELYNNLSYYKSRISTIQSMSPIRIVNISGSSEAKKKAEELRHANLDVRAIVAPTVQEGSERLRICLHSYNTYDEIDILAAGLLTE